MIEKLAENLINLKKEFVSDFDGSSQIQEFLPLSNSDLFPIDKDELKLLHEFAEKNPIYYNSFSEFNLFTKFSNFLNSRVNNSISSFEDIIKK